MPAPKTYFPALPRRKSADAVSTNGGDTNSAGTPDNGKPREPKAVAEGRNQSLLRAGLSSHGLSNACGSGSPHRNAAAHQFAGDNVQALQLAGIEGAPRDIQTLKARVDIGVERRPQRAEVDGARDVVKFGAGQIRHRPAQRFLH